MSCALSSAGDTEILLNARNPGSDLFPRLMEVLLSFRLAVVAFSLSATSQWTSISSRCSPCTAIGVGTPRGLQGRVTAVIATLLALIAAIQRRLDAGWRVLRHLAAVGAALASSATHLVKSSRTVTYTTDC